MIERALAILYGADDATHQANSGGKAPVAALDSAEIDERVEDFSGLRAQ